MRLRVVLLGLLLGSSAGADQTDFSIQKGEDRWHFAYSWTDREQSSHQTGFVLNASSVQADLERSLRISAREVAKHEAEAVNQWGKHQPEVAVRAKMGLNGAVTISAEGEDTQLVERALKRADHLRQEARTDYLVESGYKEYPAGVAPDYVSLISEYAPEMGSLAYALGGSNGDARAFLNNALLFVQNIPYETSNLYSYRRPLSLLAKNKGDCDSKVVLFLAIVHKAYPEMPLAVLDVPGHAAAMIGMPPKGKEKAYRIDEQIWVPVEPVGPGLIPLGALDDGTLNKLKSGQFSLHRL